MIENPEEVDALSRNIHSDFGTGSNSWEKITEDLVANVYSTILND